MEKEALFEKFEQDVQKRRRINRILLALDQLFNVIIWNGSQDETISSHIGRRIRQKRAKRVEIWLCIFLRKLENNHCKKSLGE